VPEKDLPVELPIIDDFRPDDTGVSPLARHESWYHVPCPVCDKRGRRRMTDVSDTFLDSAWYHLRYPSTEFGDRHRPRLWTKHCNVRPLHRRDGHGNRERIKSEGCRKFVDFELVFPLRGCVRVSQIG
jgi:leucyl-tRNA synthetase